MPSRSQVENSLNLALMHHQSGNLDLAAQLYRQILDQNPVNADALYLFGVLNHQLGRNEDALGLIRRAIEKNRRNADWFNTLGEIYRSLHCLDEASQAYSRALKLNPKLVAALGNLGLLLQDQGKPSEAAEYYRRVLRLEPRSTPALINLGSIAQEEGKFPEAEDYYRRAIEADPKSVDAHYNWGLLCRERQEWEQARRHFEIVVGLQPAHAEAWLALGKAWTKLTHYDHAVRAFEKAIALRGHETAASYHLAVAMARAGKHEEAKHQFEGVIAHYKTVLETQPKEVEPYLILANAQNELGAMDEATKGYERALEINPDCVEALVALANIHLLSNQDPREALRLFEKALQFNPHSALLHRNIGSVLTRLGRPEEAFASFRRSLALSPDYAGAHFNFSLALLAHGRFGEAWREYEYRTQFARETSYIQDPRNPNRVLPKPSSLLPLDLESKRVLFLFDQGIGDELFFLRFMPVIRAKGAWLAYQPSSKLVDMVSRTGALDKIVEAPDFPADLDYIFSVCEAPLVAGMQTVDDVPPPLLLSPVVSEVDRMRQCLAEAGPPPYLGVTWRGGLERQPGETARLLKQLEPNALANAIRKWPGTVLILQRNPKPGEIDEFTVAAGREVCDFSAFNENLEAMLALLSLIDDYAGVSNANMHLRVGLGRTARVLIPHPPEWRWMAEGEESPWFPGFKLYRQGLDGDWGAVIDSLARDLANSVSK